MKLKAKGTVCGIIAAVSYGTNPLGALSLYQEGIHVNSVLFYRYSLAALVILLLLFVRKESLRINKAQLKVLSILGLLFASSSITLFTSFHYIDAGVASTILFVYPIMVAVLMAVFFKERVTPTTVISIALALMGISMLTKSSDGAMLSTMGIILVFISALTYAIYIIVVNKAHLKMSVFKLTFYVLVFCDLTTLTYSLLGGGEPLQLLTTWSAWGYAWMLALIPTVISLVTMAVAVKEIGSTPTAIMGALEPLTAVVIGVTMFGEELTFALIVGIIMILTSVLLIIMGKAFSFRALIQQFVQLGKRHGKM